MIAIRPPPRDPNAPSPERFAVLHPANQLRGSFREEGVYWPSVARYCLARSLASPLDREKVRVAKDPSEAQTLAKSMARTPEADAETYEVLVHALTLACETNLSTRAVLLETGQERLEAHLGPDARLGVGEDGGGENLLGRALMAVRERVRVRAENPAVLQCRHQDEEEDARVVCEHVLAEGTAFHRHFSGVGADHELLCAACAEALPTLPPRRRLCRDCFFDRLGSKRLSDLGAPELRTRPSTVVFSHRLLAAPTDVVALAPLARVPNTWLLLDRTGRLHRVDAMRGSVELGGQVDPAAVELSQPLVLVAAPGGELAAVGEAKGRRAVVLEPASGKVHLTLERGDYHVTHCRFPLAFVEREGRLLLVHATDWNRLDVTDPRTGERLTAREPVAGQDGRPGHVLDYFYSGLHLSPDGAWALSTGWVWQPVGQVRIFNLKRWLDENVWESEDGASVKNLSWREYAWDGPVAWLDATTVATWGEGDDELNLVPAAELFNVESGKRLRTFYGPGEGLASVPPYLVAFDKDRGTTVWDWRTGERLAQDNSFVPLAVHPASHELLSWSEDGRLRVSRLVE